MKTIAVNTQFSKMSPIASKIPELVNDSEKIKSTTKTPTPTIRKSNNQNLTTTTTTTREVYANLNNTLMLISMSTIYILFNLPYAVYFIIQLLNNTNNNANANSMSKSATTKLNNEQEEREQDKNTIMNLFYASQHSLKLLIISKIFIYYIFKEQFRSEMNLVFLKFLNMILCCCSKKILLPKAK
jgi:hypothetical protein